VWNGPDPPFYGQPGLNPLDALLAAFKTAAIEP
jgi:hypothetical protein